MKIPFLDLSPMHSEIRDEIFQSFTRVYERNWFVLGAELEDFERQYALFSNTKHAIGVSNGLDALHLCLQALCIGKGDEVIVPSNTYIATVLAITEVGATPVLVEPDMQTYNIDPKKIEEKITGKTKAIMPVHLYGQACEMDAIMNIATRYNIFVVEDNAQSHGATFNGKITGSFGVLNGTSFYPGKNLGALGDGGAITSDDVMLIEIVKKLRNYGSNVKYLNDVLGHNMRLDEIQSAFLKVKLGYLQKWTNERIKIAGLYQKMLQSVDVILPSIHNKATHVYHLFVIRVDKRDDLQGYLTKKGIGTLIHYPIPPHLQPCYKSFGYKQGQFPIAEKIASTCLSLPLYPGLGFNQIVKITEAIKSFFGRANK